MKDKRDSARDGSPKHVDVHTHTREACVDGSDGSSRELWDGDLDEELSDRIHERLAELARTTPWPRTRAALRLAAVAVELARRTYYDEAPS